MLRLRARPAFAIISIRESDVQGLGSLDASAGAGFRQPFLRRGPTYDSDCGRDPHSFGAEYVPWLEPEFWVTRNFAIDVGGLFSAFSTEELDVPILGITGLSSGTELGFRAGVVWFP